MRPRFSRRVSWDLTASDASLVAREARRRHPDLNDLTETNPTRVGLVEPARAAALVGGEGATCYAPDARGTLPAREAVSGYYASRGLAVDPEQVVLSASTSEAYSWLFKLLCDEGDEVLVPTPSYPLFSYLAVLEGARVVTYPLMREEGFKVDTDELARRASSPRVRAIVVVAPNNPTGTALFEDEARAIDRLAAERGVPVIVDEVFGDYFAPQAPAGVCRSYVGEREALSFVLSGLSKVCCAPGMKLAWTVVQGPTRAVREAIERLEVVADTFLSVSTPVQLALPEVLARRPAIQRELGARIATNRAALARAVANASSGALRVAPSHGGWSCLLEVPRVGSEDDWVRRLALDAAVLVQPGYFFDLTDGGTLVVSSIVDPGRFEAGVQALVREVEAALR